MDDAPQVGTAVVDLGRDELVAWIRSVTGATEVALERAVVRREGYVVHLDGRRAFLRLGRADDPANLPDVAVSEARLVRILGAQGMTVPHVLGDDPRLGAALYDWVDGRADLEHVPDAGIQQRLLEAYAGQLALLHRIDPVAAGIDWLATPAGPRACALAHAEAVWSQMGHLALEPLATFGMRWLHWHVPDRMTRLSVLHGDAGVGNFLFLGDRLTGVVDWEWAHLGDPMEDLGAACMHAGFHEAGDLGAALDHYEATSGIRVDRSTVRYYTVHLYVRSVVALAAHCAQLDPHNPVALNLAYKLVNDRLACEAVADALGVELERPHLPADAATTTSLHDVVVANLRDEVVPALGPGVARDRAEGAARLVAAFERDARLGPALRAAERDELGALLGHPVTDLDDGLAELDRSLRTWGPDRELDVLGYLYRRAVRAEWLAAPVSDRFPDRHIARLGDRGAPAQAPA